MRALACLALACGSAVPPLETRFELEGGDAAARAAVASAVAEWRAAAPGVVAIELVPRGEGDAVIRLAPSIRDGALSGRSDFEGGAIEIDETIGAATRRVALHEIGHWLAWSAEHSADERDVMYAPVRAERLTARDVERVTP